MKIEQLLVQHFYKHKMATLQGMGILTLSSDVIFPADNDKTIEIPANAIHFTYDDKAKEDESLINFIVQQTRKIRPLAASDLESYFALGKQFLNLGKPFIIEGIGTLHKNQQGLFEFIPGHYVSQKTEVIPAQLKEKPEGDISFASPEKERGRKKWLFFGLTLFILALAGLSAWYFLVKKNSNEETDQNVIERNNVETIDSTHKIDTLLQKPSLVSKPVNKEGYTFKIVFEESINKKAAIEKMDLYIKRGHKIIMYTPDSIFYKLAEPFSNPLADTTRIRDSLHRFYYPGKTRVELY